MAAQFLGQLGPVVSVCSYYSTVMVGVLALIPVSTLVLVGDSCQLRPMAVESLSCLCSVVSLSEIALVSSIDPDPDSSNSHSHLPLAGSTETQ